MTLSRRDLLKYGLHAGLLIALPRPLLADFGRGPEPIPPIQDPRVRALAERAVEAARAAGAAYADVRLTHTRIRDYRAASIRSVLDREDMVAGVRVLVDGYWGFAGSPVWSPDEMARLATEAVSHARVSSVGGVREVELVPAPPATGHWKMPVEIDPFEVSPFEIIDYLSSLAAFASKWSEWGAGQNSCSFQVQEKAFASSEGSYCTQQLYRSEGAFTITLQKDRRSVARGSLDVLTPAGLGWELYTRQPLRELILQLMEEVEEHWKLPPKPVEVGRFAAACDARTVARFADATLGRATELDRALGYEANAGGTSYLADPLSMLGTHEVGPATLTLRGNRSEPGAAATVQWDDEGVRPDDLIIIREGTLNDFQTTRESAGWLADVYARRSMPVQSHGCAGAPTALQAPLQHSPNLVLDPGSAALDFDGAIAELEQGVAIRGLGLDMDFQGMNGLGTTDRIYEVRNGRKVARIVGAGVLFRAPELWKGLQALGGRDSVRRYGMSAVKGEPAQRSYHSVSAPPAVFDQVTLIDVARKA